MSLPFSTVNPISQHQEHQVVCVVCVVLLWCGVVRCFANRATASLLALGAVVESPSICQKIRRAFNYLFKPWFPRDEFESKITWFPKFWKLLVPLKYRNCNFFSVSYLTIFDKSRCFFGRLLNFLVTAKISFDKNYLDFRKSFK